MHLNISLKKELTMIQVAIIGQVLGGHFALATNRRELEFTQDIPMSKALERVEFKKAEVVKISSIKEANS